MPSRNGPVFIPAPTSGINTAAYWGPTDDPREAYQLDNFICERGYVRLRPGIATWSTDDPASKVWLHTYYGASGPVLIGTSGLKFYRFTYNAALTDITGATVPTSGYIRYSTSQMGTVMVLVNGNDTPQQYNGTAVSDATYTGSGLTPASLRAVTNYRDRFYFLGANFDLWYGGSAAVTGALTKVDLTSVFQRGSKAYAIATWTGDDGAGLDDRLVIASDQGEVVIYAGSYPGGSDWGRIATYRIPPLASERCLYNVGGDLYALTQRGIIPFSSLVVRGNQPGYVCLTDQLGTLWTNENAHIVVDAEHEFMYVCGGLGSVYVQNLDTGAWSTLSFGQSVFFALGDSNRIAVHYWKTLAPASYKVGYFGNAGVGAGTSDLGTAFTATAISGFRPLAQMGTRRKVNLLKFWGRGAYQMGLTCAMYPDYDEVAGLAAVASSRTIAATVTQVPVIEIFNSQCAGELFTLYVKFSSISAVDDASLQKYIGTTVYHEEAQDI